MSLEFHSPALEGPKGCIHQKEGRLFQSLKSSEAELPPCQAAAAGAVLVSMVLASAAGELVEGQVQPEPGCTVSGIHGSAGLEEPDPPGVGRRRDTVAPGQRPVGPQGQGGHGSMCWGHANPQPTWPRTAAAAAGFVPLLAGSALSGF